MTTCREKQSIVKRTVSGFVIRKKSRRIEPIAEYAALQVSFTINETVVSGSISMTAEQIKLLASSTPCELFLVRGQLSRLLKNDEQPLYRLWDIEDGQAVRRRVYRLLLLGRYDSVFKMNWPVNGLVKLTVRNVLVQAMDLSGLNRLKYLKVTNAALGSIIGPGHILEYCNLSGNRLSRCSVLARVLDLSHNEIGRFVSSFRFEYLDLSGNEIRHFSASSKVLKIRGARLATPLHSDAFKIVADNSRRLRIGDCLNVVNLSVSNCGLKSIPFLWSLVYLKALNNRLQDLPFHPLLRCADLEGNFLTDFRLENMQWVNLSKNSTSLVDVRPGSCLEWIDASFTMPDFSLIFTSGTGCGSSSDAPQVQLRLNDSMADRTGSACRRPRKKHCCEKLSGSLFRYQLYGHIAGCPVRVCVVLRTRFECSGDTRKRQLNSIFLENQAESCPVLFFQKFLIAADAIFYEDDQEFQACYTMITEKMVLIKSSGIRVVYANFAELGHIEESSKIVGFVNTSYWMVCPVLCKMKADTVKRHYKLHSVPNSPREIFEFLGFFCPKSLELLLQNSPVLLDITEPGTSEEIFQKGSHRSFEEIAVEHSIDDKVDGLGCINVDYDMGLYNGSQYSTFITTANPVFCFLKFRYSSRISPILAFDELNVMKLVDFFVKMFCGRCIEKNYQFYIVGFNGAIPAILWGLRVRETLEIAGVDVGIAFTRDTVFRSEEDGRVVFGGPVFNKLSRIADLGIGVFMSDGFKISHPIIKLVREGCFYLKGFKDAVQIFSLRSTHAGFF